VLCGNPARVTSLKLKRGLKTIFPPMFNLDRHQRQCDFCILTVVLVQSIPKYIKTSIENVNYEHLAVAD